VFSNSSIRKEIMKRKTTARKVVYFRNSGGIVEGDLTALQRLIHALLYHLRALEG